MFKKWEGITTAKIKNPGKFKNELKKDNNYTSILLIE